LTVDDWTEDGDIAHSCDVSSLITLSLQQTISQTVTSTYDGMALSIDTNPYSISIQDFTKTEVQNAATEDPVKVTYGFGQEYSAYMNRIKAAGADILSWNEVLALGDAVYRYYYFGEGEDDQSYTSSIETLKTTYPQYESAYYHRWIDSKNKVRIYAIDNIVVKQIFTKQITNVTICNVTEISSSCRLNSNATSVFLGQGIQGIPDNSFFADATQLTTVVVSPSNNYLTFENGILYGNKYSTTSGTAVIKYKDKIITGTTETTSQTIPDSIKTIYTDAFKNVPDGVVITSMNIHLTINGNDNYVTFLVPSSEATVSDTEVGGGFTVTGNITQAHINNLALQGTYMDFTGAHIMTNIHFDNAAYQGNTLLYFENPANSVTGDKNVIVDGVCQNCIINDNGGDRFYCPIEFTAKNLTYTREFDDMWKTITLPFNLSEDDLGGNMILGRLNGFNFSTYTFDFIYSNSITAYYPYIAKYVFSDDVFILKDLENVIVKEHNPRLTNINGAQFIPVYERQQLYSSYDVDYNYYGIQNIYNAEEDCYRNHIQLCEGVYIRPFRAYLKAFKPLDYYAAKFRLLDAMGQIIEEGEMPISTSGIENVKETETSKATYNLNGQRVNNAHRGLNIVNGKVVLNK
jgi:hypothetical protein